MNQAGDQKRFEAKDASARAILWLAAGLAVLLAVTLVGVWWFYRAQLGYLPGAPGTPAANWSISEAHLVEIHDDREYVDQVAERAHEYGWVSKERGIARIPVEVAIRRIAESGALPEWGTGEAKNQIEEVERNAAGR